MSNDLINHPKHYTEHPSGIECIQITEHMGFNLGNAIKYIWRADLKHDAIEDMRKAVWYLEREISKRVSQCPPLHEPVPAPATPPSKHQFVLPIYDGEYRVCFIDETSCKAVFKNRRWYDYETLKPIIRELTYWTPL